MSVSHELSPNDPLARYQNIGCNSLTAGTINATDFNVVNFNATNLTVTGTTNLNNTINNGLLSVTGITTLNNDLSVTGTTTLNNTVNNGTLNVTGLTTLNSIVFASQNPIGTATSSAGSTGTVQIAQYFNMIASVGPTGIITQSGGITSIAHTNGTGIYQVNFNAFANIPFIIATIENTSAYFATISAKTTTQAQISTFNSAGVAADAGFTILIYGR